MSHALPQPYAAELAVSSRSRWRDPVWHLDGVRPGTAPGEFSLNWAFKIGDGRFTDPKWRAWCEATKTFLWSLKADPPPGRRPVHESTLVSTFKLLRLLIRWMASIGWFHQRPELEPSPVFEERKAWVLEQCARLQRA